MPNHSSNRIVRTVTVFAERPTSDALSRAAELAERLRELGYVIQTTRACFGKATLEQAAALLERDDQFASVGSLTTADARAQLGAFAARGNTSFHVDISAGVTADDVDFFYELMDTAPERTFGFSWVAHNPPSGPFFNAARFETPGFAVGLQSTDLAAGCETLEEWQAACARVWLEINGVFSADPDFLGIDSSVAPMGGGDGSLVRFLRRIAPQHGAEDFSQLATTDVFTRITEHLDRHTPSPVGLCGLMLPCLEDAGLAEEYEQGNFGIERNLWLSMHCGLGIDTYPIGRDEDPERVLQILQLLRALAHKHEKPLACRFVADRAAKIGDRTDFQSPYLTDVTVRPL